MAHTVESLSKLLRKTPDQVIAILTGAGISGKTAESNISADERQILMSSLSKRSGTKSTISVSRKTPKQPEKTPSSGGVKIQVKKKREVPQNTTSETVDDAAILKAKQALEAGRLSEQKDEEHDAKRNDMVRQQKILMYVFPLMFGIFGINFPIGVLIYWFSTNLWSMGQQFYVIRNNPQPNTPAYTAWEGRQKEKGARKAVKRGEAESVEDALKAEEPKQTPRSQPKKKSRSQRKRGPGSQKSDPSV